MKFRMDRRLKFGVLVIMLMGFGVLAGCSGKDGKNGTNGTNGNTGPTGPSGTAQCMQCHTDDFSIQNYLLPVETEFAVSKHAVGDTDTERNAPCSGCHTTEGYQQRILDGTFPNLVTSSHIGCFACHAPHKNMGTDQPFSQRKTGATTFVYGGATYDKQSSNTCAMCHQARVPKPNPASVDSAITSSRWGPHHGSQADYLTGTGAYVLTGATYSANHPHNTQIADGCVHCHMGPNTSGDNVGGHTFGLLGQGRATGGTPNVRRLPTSLDAGLHRGTAFDRWPNRDLGRQWPIEGAQTEFDGLLDSSGRRPGARGATAHR